jgi:porphobilinogen synthase
LLIKQAKSIAMLSVLMISLFPVIEPGLKSLHAEESYNLDHLVQRAVRALKDAVPELGVLTDMALNAYTTHGQDSIIDEQGYVINDVTKDILVRQALASCRGRSRNRGTERYDGWPYQSDPLLPRASGPGEHLNYSLLR